MADGGRETEKPVHDALPLSRQFHVVFYRTLKIILFVCEKKDTDISKSLYS